MTTDPCALSLEWLLDPELAKRVVLAAYYFSAATGRELEVISGFRTCDRQRELEEQGLPAAPCELSNHTICPARAVDVRFEGYPARVLVIALGVAATAAGLRWGGGGPTDDDGVPVDWRHLDLGPRQDAQAREYRQVAMFLIRELRG